MSSISITRREALSLAASVAGVAGVLTGGEVRAVPAGGRMPAELDRFIRAYLPAMNAPGLTLGLTSAQETLHTAGYGYADLSAKTPVSAAHLFEIGSISKSFVALMVLQLQEEGKIDLHKPILHYLPWLAMETLYGEVSIHHLLTHSSGMPDDAPLFPLVPGTRPQQGFMPGTKFHYSNWGYDVLGSLVEKMDGGSWDAALRRRILAPLGMTATSPLITSSIRARLVQSYVPLYDDRPYPRHGALTAAGNLTVTTAAGCIASTPGDMARYMRMLLSRGAGPSSRIVSEDSFKLFSTPYIQADDFGPGASYGYGLAVDQLDGHKRLRHTGGMASFMSALHLDLDAGFGAFASINAQLGYRPNPVAQYALQLLRARQERKSPPPPPPADAALTIANPEQYAGVYTAADGRRLEVRAAKDRLVLRADDQDIELQQAPEADQFIADHPKFALYPLVFGRAPAKSSPPVTDLAYGADSYFHADHPQTEPPAGSTALSGYAGQYYSESPWLGSARVVLRRGQLWWGGSAVLVPCGDRTFRIGPDSSSPDTLEFVNLVDGQARGLTYAGGVFKRVPEEMA
jgi:D-alanyl-D-alanine carboxypeptidase